MKELNGLTTSFSLSATGEFVQMWRRYLAETGRKSARVIQEIVKKPEDYFDFVYKGKGVKMTLGVVCYFSDKEQFAEMFDRRERSKNMCDMMYTYMKKHPNKCEKKIVDGKFIYVETEEKVEICE